MHAVSIRAEASPKIQILGPVEVDGIPVRGEVLCGVLVLLVLARDRRLAPERLFEAWSNGRPSSNSVQQQVSKLRNEYALDISYQHTYYQLVVARDDVDADRFIDGVARVSEVHEPAEIDRLLAHWRDDPRLHSMIAREHWAPVFRARSRIAALLAAMPAADRERLSALGDFLRTFPDDSELALLREPRRELMRQPVRGDGWSARRRQRVLIVDDQVADAFEHMLQEIYDCVLVRSLRDWRDLVRKGDLDFDMAIVDLHLTATTDDQHGVEVMEYLRDFTSIPMMLASVAHPPGPVEATIDRYQLGGFYIKDPRDAMPHLRAEVARVIRQGRRRPANR